MFCFLPGESRGRGSLVGCHLWGRTESDTTAATQQQNVLTIKKQTAISEERQDLISLYYIGGSQFVLLSLFVYHF